MYKIVSEDNQKFRVKEIDDNGNSVRLFEEIFSSKEDAQIFIDDMKPTKKKEEPEPVDETEKEVKPKKSKK